MVSIGTGFTLAEFSKKSLRIVNADLFRIHIEIGNKVPECAILRN